MRVASMLGDGCEPRHVADDPGRLSSSPRTAKLIRQTPARASGRRQKGRTVMQFTIGHVHIKTRAPKETAQFYMDNFGATMKREVDGRGFQLDLHGLQLNVTTIIDSQKHEQKLGIEHIALQTDDYPATLARLKENGAKIIEELFNNGRHVCWVEAPDGAQMEVIEKV
jgi:predicted enzyme related to lactoylglutathione lyase